VEKLQDDQNDHDHNENVNPVSGAREPRADIPPEKSEQPQDEQNDDNGPQHTLSPFSWIDPPEATGSPGRVAPKLPAQQDEDAGCDGEDRQDHSKATNAQQRYYAPGDEKNGQQQHSDIPCDSHGFHPF
jgi:hypothetical protein